MSNSADPDQTPQNAVFDQDLPCLLELKKANDELKQFPLRTIFPAYSQRQSTQVLNSLHLSIFFYLSNEMLLITFRGYIEN